MQDRTVVWSDPAVQTAARAFVPVAVEVTVATAAEGASGDWFRRLARQGHYGGALFTPTQQGTYCATPIGRLLASGNDQRADATRELLQKALAEWRALPAKERAPRAASAATAPSSTSPQMPAGGLTLTVTTQRFFDRALSDQPVDARRLRAAGLPRYLRRYAADKPETYHEVARNHDHAWFTADEVRRLLPAELLPGSCADADPALVERLCRLHMLDTVRAIAEPYPRECVRSATLGAEIVAVTDGMAQIRFEGEVHLHEAELPPLARVGDRTAPIPRQPQRGYRADMLGRAEYDVATHKFVTFELVVLGEKLGGSKLSAFERTTMGVAFVLAPATDGGHHPPPRFLAEYGW